MSIQEFGSDDTPLHESEYTMPTIDTYKGRKRRRRSLQKTTTVTVILDKHTLDQIVFAINKTGKLFYLFTFVKFIKRSDCLK